MIWIYSLQFRSSLCVLFTRRVKIPYVLSLRSKYLTFKIPYVLILRFVGYATDQHEPCGRLTRPVGPVANVV